MAERWHRELIDNLPHYVFSVDDQDRYVTVNRAACEFFGRPESEIIGRTAVELGIPADVAEQWLEQNRIVRAAGETRVFDEILRTVDGDARHIQAILSPVRDEAGNIAGVSGISIDLTDLKTAEATAHGLLGAIEQLDEVMFTTDRNGTITYVNGAFERVYGYSRDEAIGQTPRILKSEELAASAYEQFWSELLAGRSVRMEYRNRAKDGSLVEVVGSASPVLSEKKTVIGFIAVQQDVTEQKRMDEERRVLDERAARLDKIEALGTLAGGMAHDFNNILAIILTHSDLIERCRTEPERVAAAITTIRKAVQRGATLSKQILTIARRAEIRCTRIHIGSLLTELESMIAETFPRTISVTLNIRPNLPMISADADQLLQALLNLCLNARDAMPSGGELTIETQLVSASEVPIPGDGERDFVRISVADAGTGMDEETRRRLFEPFFTTKPKGKGTGLGLPLVYGVVKSHGGMIDVDSTPGAGTTFRLYFPTVENGTEVADRNPQAGVRGGTESLLIVEDEAQFRDTLVTHLRIRGYRVIAAADGLEAIERLQSTSNAPDAVVMDLGMPKMEANDLLLRLRENAPRMPIVAMTGYVDPEVHAGVIAAGVRHVLQKPFEIDELLRSLRQVLD